MNIQDTLAEIQQIEQEFLPLFKQWLSNFNGEDIGLSVRIVNDTVDLIQDLSRDSFLFNLSYNNYNNGVSFLPYYYFENFVMHDDMIWERLLILIALAYQIDFDSIFKNKGISVLYECIKKSVEVDTKIKELLLDIVGNSKMRQLKFVRNGNQHYISKHLAVRDNPDKLDDNMFYLNDDILYRNMDRVHKRTLEIDREQVERAREVITIVSEKQKKYIEILKVCILRIGEAFRKPGYVFRQKKHFLPDDSKALHWRCDGYDRCKYLEELYTCMREKYRTVVNYINSRADIIVDEGAFIRVTLLTDTIFRAKEVVRSLNWFWLCFYYDGNNILNIGDSNQSDFVKFCCNDVVSSSYYSDYALLKLYSVCEKLAKYLICKYDHKQDYTDETDFKGLYLEKVCELLTKNGISSVIIDRFLELISSEAYKEYEKLRIREYHCLRIRYIVDEPCMVTVAYLTNITDLMFELIELLDMIIEEETTEYMP